MAWKTDEIAYTSSKAVVIDAKVIFKPLGGRKRGQLAIEGLPEVLLIDAVGEKYSPRCMKESLKEKSGQTSYTGKLVNTWGNTH